jgi:hypothetical protein
MNEKYHHNINQEVRLPRSEQPRQSFYLLSKVPRRNVHVESMAVTDLKLRKMLSLAASEGLTEDK